jgi:hypothetical protein
MVVVRNEAAITKPGQVLICQESPNLGRAPSTKTSGYGSDGACPEIAVTPQLDS